MFSSSSLTMPSTSSQLFSAYASLTGTIMLFRSMANELIPNPVRDYFVAKFEYWFTLSPLSTSLTLVVDENSGYTRNQVYDAAETYLRTKISPSAERLNICKTPRQKQISIAIEKGEEIDDVFEGVKLKWRYVHSEGDQHGNNSKKYYELTVDKKSKQKVLDRYVPFVLEKAKEIKERDKVVKLFTLDGGGMDDENGGNYGGWGSINLEHPSTFETLAMDPKMKKTIVDDLERFVRRRDFYKKVGKAWKRGYLLYGPPGTGKSSLIAAIANYLKFDIYDLELSSLYSNSELRRVLLSTTNRSVLVIEDIDCSPEVLDRDQCSDNYDPPTSSSKFTLSGLLNFIDGLWSSCGDERIIVFTTNHKEMIDPALLRPGRMDMHIHMSYCTPSGFRILASNYLGIDDEHSLFGEIESLIEAVEITPAEIAEELMKSDDGDVALDGLVQFLKNKSVKCNEAKEEVDAGEKTEPLEIKRVKNESKKSKKQQKKNHRR